VIVRLKDVVRINPSTLPENTAPGVEFRYIDISAVSVAGAITLPDKQITFADAPSRARRLARPGATVVSTVRTYLRAIAQVPDQSGLVFSTGFAVLEPTAAIDPDYLFFFFCRSDGFIDSVRSRSGGGSYPAINASDIGAFRLHLPRSPSNGGWPRHFVPNCTA
jgi:type I restriction enzyme S subunit